MDSKALKFVLIVAILSMLLPLGLIVLLLISGTPSATGREAEQVDADTPDDSANVAQDPTLDEDIDPDGTTLPTNHPSHRSDGGPVQGPPTGLHSETAVLMHDPDQEGNGWATMQRLMVPPAAVVAVNILWLAHMNQAPQLLTPESSRVTLNESGQSPTRDE